MSFNWATLQRFELSAYAGATAGVDIQVKLPPAFNQEATTDVYPGGGAFTSPETISFSIAGVPVWIDVSNRVQVVMAASGKASGSIVGPGFTYDNSISVGVAYTAANGWTTIQERGVSFTQRAPSIDLRGSAALSATVILDIRFSLFSAWNINLHLKPYVGAKLDFGVSSCGGAVQLAMQVRRGGAGTPGSRAHADVFPYHLPQGGMNAAVVMSQPAVTVSLFGTFGISYTIKIPGLSAVFPVTWHMQLLAPFSFS